MNTLPPSLVRFQSQLEDAIRRDRQRRPFRLVVRTALPAAAAAAISLGLLSALPGNGPSVVDRAEAALTVSAGTILHVVMVGTQPGPGGSVAPTRLETWQESAAPYDRREISVLGDRQVESATANRVPELYDPTTNTIYAGSARSAPAGKPQQPQGGDDPYRGKILVLLQSGQVREDGHVTVDGRDAIRLVSADGTVTLEVDASTYRPIQWTVTDGGGTSSVRFSVYEQLPDDPSLVSLASQHPGARIDDDPGDYAAALQRVAGKGGPAQSSSSK